MKKHASAILLASLFVLDMAWANEEAPSKVYLEVSAPSEGKVDKEIAIDYRLFIGTNLTYQGIGRKLSVIDHPVYFFEESAGEPDANILVRYKHADSGIMKTEVLRKGDFVYRHGVVSKVYIQFKNPGRYKVDPGSLQVTIQSAGAPAINQELEANYVNIQVHA